MKTNKKIILSIIISIVLFTQIIAIPTYAQAFSTSTKNTISSSTPGLISSKEEVVYSTLDSNGKAIGVYVVNILDVEKEGTLIDFGNYSELKNLTNLQDIEIDNDTITVTADKGSFYYQGNTKITDLPWNFSIKYILDGKEINSKDLAGKTGKLKIDIKTSQNKAINSSFYNNFMLQISLGLDNDKCKNIITNKGIFANSGKNKLITYTVMPKNDLDTSITVDVTDFEMNGISITAVPFSINIDLPNTNEMTKDLVTLSSAITQLNDGVLALKNGTRSLKDGSTQLKNGSDAYLAGINTLNNQSSGLADASKNINTNMATINSSLNALCQQLNVAMPNTEISIALGQLTQALGLLANNYSSFNDGLTAYTQGVSQLANNYNDLNSGIVNIANGNASLYEGMVNVSDGTSNLNNQTKDLPTKIDSTINEMMDDYDFSDYKPISFVSSKNNNVTAVQFVITTEKIVKEKIVSNQEVKQTETFFDRLKKLFR